MEQGPGNVKRTADGKIYEYEEDGVYYGGEFLAKAPAEIEIKTEEEGEDDEQV